MDIKNLTIEDFLYDLPDERIAKYPLADRALSRLLIYKGGDIRESRFGDIVEQLPRGSVLVRNNSRVIQARLLFRKDSGATVEVFCLTPTAPASYEESLAQTESCRWQCMLGNARRWRAGQWLEKTLHGGAHGAVVLRAERIKDGEVLFSWDNVAYSFGDILELAGQLPIPPYLNRDTEPSDQETYQTVYASASGSVAAPTAGLHFTPELFESLDKAGVDTLDITLHVGAGTFRPVKADTIGEHAMHEELVIVERQTVERLRDSLGQIVAVGTTSVRSLESLYHIGVSLARGEVDEYFLKVDQWQPYSLDGEVSPEEALEAVLDYMTRHGQDYISFPTAILIAPGYRFRLVRGLVTNFHQPHSTLLLLIAAFVGDDWRRIYEYALTHGFRFLSYGDSSLLLPGE